ncbi:MAG: hypothetical protein OEU95_00270, partial [Nitrospirota bacterium]|nr:hypothetical protein [Nitrospirota bacterium]
AISCTATFIINYYALDILISGTGSGAVTSAPAGIDCGADCTEYYAYSTVVTLTAATDTGSAFIGWDGGGCSGIGTCQVTMTAAASVTAVFDSAYQPAYQLTTSVSPAGHGSMTPDCSGGCLYDSGTVVVLTAEEDNGYPFSNWLGCDAPSGNTCTITVDADRSVTAAFDSCQYPVRTSSYYYSVFQDAYDDAVPGDTIQSRNMDFFEDIFIDLNKPVTITGGYDCDYTAVTGRTTINGNMITSSGMVIIQNGTIELR